MFYVWTIYAVICATFQIAFPFSRIIFGYMLINQEYKPVEINLIMFYEHQDALEVATSE